MPTQMMLPEIVSSCASSLLYTWLL